MENKNENMYGDTVFTPSTPDSEHIPESSGTTSNSVEIKRIVPDTVIYFDLDRGLTLGKCIKKIRKMADQVSDNTVITLYFIKTSVVYCYWLSMLWSYLLDTGRKYNLAFRGVLPNNGCFNEKYDTIFEISVNRDIEAPDVWTAPEPHRDLLCYPPQPFSDHLTKLGYKFEFI